MTAQPEPPPTPALTGACACCGTATGSLFAQGHDARYKSALSRALSAGGWDAPVPWFGPTQQTTTVTGALERVQALLGRSWREKVELAASRVSSPRTRATASVSVFTPRNLAAERVSALLDRLDGHPLTGQWGWWRPPAGGRYPARVQATHRDDGDSRLTLYTPDAFKAGVITSVVVSHVEPGQWLRDEQARTG